ncbi:1721_t:CDS:2, partial [Gigaspora margarita]
KVLNLFTMLTLPIPLYGEPSDSDSEQASTFMDKAKQASTYRYMNEAEQMSIYMDEAEQKSFYMDKAETYIDEAEQVSIYIGEAKVSESSSSQSKESNPIQLKGSSVYQDGTTSNLKKHLKQYKSRVPELNESKVKQGGVSVIEILNNNTSVS